MKVCPSCGELFGNELTACTADGSALAEWGDSLAETLSSRGVPPTTDGLAAAWDVPTLAHEPAVGRLLVERYRLDRQIGVGGYGVVFSAADTRLDKRVAVKVLSPRFARSSEDVERFRREALAASAIHHDGIVSVTDFDTDVDGTRFIVMEYLDGVDLAEVLDREGVLPPRRALDIAAQVASALAAAHDAGILHRDLKPANLYLTHTRYRHDMVKILDFGISKITNRTRDDVSLTSSQLILGTPYYMSHEHAQGLELDGRTDAYALGVILYEMVVGRRPFEGKTAIEILTKAATSAPVFPSAARPELGLPAALDDLILRALARDRDARHGSMAAFGDAIAAVADEIRGGVSATSDAGRSVVSYEPAVGEDVRKPSTLESSSGEIRRAVPGRPRRGVVVFLAGAIALAVAVTLVIDQLVGREDRGPSTPRPAAPAETSQPAAAPSPASPSPASPISPSPAATAGEPEPATAAEPEPATTAEPEPATSDEAAPARSRDSRNHRRSRSRARPKQQRRKLPDDATKSKAGPRRPRQYTDWVD